MFYPFYYDKTMLILIPAVIIAFWAQSKVSSTYRKYREQRMANGYTGEQVARMILDGAGLYNVPVLLTEGELSDHYDPSKRLIKLSRDIFYGNSIAAAGIAAHEVGHAIQHQKDNDAKILLTMSQDNGQLVLTIWNNQSTFSKNVLQHAGNLFYKEDQARTPSQESHFGLGLSFVKRVMKLHNGTMHLENIHNGAQVKLIIPIII